MKLKRVCSFVIAIICFCTSFLGSVHTTAIVTQAATFRGKNIWTGGAAIVNGRSRNYLYRWTDGWQMTFCIMPGNHMGSTIRAGAIRTTVDDENIPYIESREDYERLAMICSWFDANGSIHADNATYAAAQSAVWAVIGDGWETGDLLARIVDEHVRGTYDRWITLKEYVEGSGSEASSLPDWCSVSSVSGKAQQMMLKDGIWCVELDTSQDPEFAFLNWKFEGDAAGWSRSVESGKLKFTYEGSKQEEMLVSAVLPETKKHLAKNTTSLNIYIPEGDPNKIQAMISAGPYEGKLYIKLVFAGGSTSESGTEGEAGSEVMVYQHSETFLAHYNLELEKYCAETGKALEGVLFQVLEAFDDSQLRGNLEASCMTPKPVSWDDFKVCAELLTDENGTAAHTDRKEYAYSKTYCGGHPEPEYMEIPDETENPEESAAVEEANEETRRQWEALVQACEEMTDFHSEEPGMGLQMMLEDREETYEQFIHLQYDYTVEETQARYGYIRHGLHHEDEAIPIVRIQSAEAGGDYEIIGNRTGAAVSDHLRQLHQIGLGTPSQASESMEKTWEVSTPSQAYCYRMPDVQKGELLIRSLEEEDSELPLPQEDDISWIETAGNSDQVSYVYRIYDHRTEGQVHMCKKDLELSVGQTQGDAILEGAVYGLYAAEDIIHPDGKSGVVFRKGELTSKAVTDAEGKASFFTYTEQPGYQHEGISDISWVGHPLILGQYYIKEISRSEGYELSVHGKDRQVTNLHTEEAAVEVLGRADTVTAMSHPIDMHDGSWLEFDVKLWDTSQGFEILVSGFPEDSSFYRSKMDEEVETEQVVTGTRLVLTGEYERAEAGEYKLDSDGNYLPLMDETGQVQWNLESSVSRTYYAVQRLRSYPSGTAYPELDLGKWEDVEQIDTDYVTEEANHMLEQIGYRMLDPNEGDDAPWTILSLSGTTNQELIEELLDWFAEHRFWDSAAISEIWLEEGNYRAAVFHDYTRSSAVCIDDGDNVYVREEFQVEEHGTRHIFVEYDESEIQRQGRYVTVNPLRTITAPVHWFENLEARLETVYQPLYQRYEEGEYRLDGEGNPIPIYRTEFIYGEKEEISSQYALSELPSVYEAESGCHRIYVRNTFDWNQEEKPVTITVRAVANGTSVADAGSEEFYSDRLTNIQGVGASAFAPIKLPEDSYLQLVQLTYPGQISVTQDGAGQPGKGSTENPVVTQQRVIKQKIKVMKEVQKTSDAEDERLPLSNFRFKVYLKSNLERLYRDSEGTVLWLEQEGQQEAETLVPVLHTKGEKNPLYERILEGQNYEKFFQAMRVADHDKWDDAAPSYTSYRPIGNRWNRIAAALENRKASDQVRQFAIDWYLDEEVERLSKAPMVYGDELYDKALELALEKAEDYLKPFFQYDLNTIYAIAWDPDLLGGSDQDKTTISADQWSGDCNDAISAYLPYGTYIVVEQQPQYAKWNDYPNRHYQIDTPKEVTIPSVYVDYDAFCQTPPGFSSFYQYKETMTEERFQEIFRIDPRNKEWSSGTYLSALVPWSMVEPQEEATDMEPLPSGESKYYGYAGVRFRNVWYRAVLRLEKLDAETHENILHDEAVFQIYRAECDTSISGDGEVKRYEEDTMISGSQGFLESVGASQITPIARQANETCYTGIVPAGTPIFQEEDLVVMDGQVNVTTLRKGQMEDADLVGQLCEGKQNVGYLETPEPLPAGTYVLVESKAPAGYLRMKPEAIELYSDQIAYYKDGDRKTIAAVYERDRNQMVVDEAVLYAENVPTKIRVEKVKEASKDQAYTTEDKTVTWKVNGRVDGSLAQIGDDPNYEYAYLNGEYQGYAWRKGTLEYLYALRQVGKQVEIVYDGPLFAGYGYITEMLKSAEAENPYVPGARMTLFEAKELIPSGDQGDYAYEGLKIERNWNQEVIRMTTEDGNDILYYDLSNLQVLEYQWEHGRRRAYGYDRQQKKIAIEQLEQERRYDRKTDQELSIYVFRENRPYLEVTGGDFSSITYSRSDHYFYGSFAQLERDRNGNYRMSDGLLLYHLDQDGNRDSLVDPTTGMAYILQDVKKENGQCTKKVLVWPVKISRDDTGHVIAKDKITTFRIAAMEEHDDSGYLTGTWQQDQETCSHRAATVLKNSEGQNLNGETLLVENQGQMTKQVYPVLDVHGRVIYYQKADSGYQEETPLYDRDGELVRNKQADLWNAYHLAGYQVNGGSIYHRQGENYILENTWITGDQTPNDPFHLQMTEGQADLLKRVPVGSYIMEEVTAPSGYVKGFPQGVIVQETEVYQDVRMVDYATKLMIGKIDGTKEHNCAVRDMMALEKNGTHPILGYRTEGKSSYSYQPLSGAHFRLKQQGGSWSDNWISDETFRYLEEVPVGNYVLEEHQTPDGFVSGDREVFQVKNTREVQTIFLYNDHTKLEIEKYVLEQGRKVLLKGAGFTLYALEDEETPILSWRSSDQEQYRGFIDAFESMYREYGTSGTTISWNDTDSVHTAVQKKVDYLDASLEGGTETVFPISAVLLYQMENGNEIRITVYQQEGKRWGRDFCFEYQFEYQKLPQVNPYAVTYVTVEGIRRFDYLPVGESYRLVETEVPDGFAKAEDIWIRIEDMPDIQRYSIQNEESKLLISKCSEEGEGELVGAQMVLYRAGSQGELIMDSAHLAATWTSGMDGVYTELDEINHKLPNGYRVGDRKPHTLRRLPDGIYYLTEQKAPDYYTLMEPQKIIYRQEEEIRLIRVTNEVVKGELRIQKTDRRGEPLSGAIFQLTAYLEEHTVFMKQYSEHGGELWIKDLPVGKVQQDGKILPYRYELQEIIPPEGYAVSSDNYEFSFDAKSYAAHAAAKKELCVVNEKTRIQIGKEILGMLQVEDRPMYAADAGLTVYHTEGRDEQGEYLYHSNQPIAEWITSDAEPIKELVGLIAGHTYLLVETRVPEGLLQMKPIAFSISQDGRRIERIESDTSAISVLKVEDGTAEVKLQRRSGVGIEVSVKNAADQELACWMADGHGHRILAGELPEDGMLIVTESVIYSDGSREMIRRITQHLELKEDEVWIADRSLKQVFMEVTDAEGRSALHLEEEIEKTGILECNQEYQVSETCLFSDGSSLVSGNLRLVVNEQGEIQRFHAYDKEPQVWIYKKAEDASLIGTEGTELAGAELQLRDEQGSVLEEWITEENGHKLRTTFMPGETYLVHEAEPPKGWSYAPDLLLVPSDAVREEIIVMTDKPTHVRICKTDITGSEAIEGALLQVLDMEKQVLAEWRTGVEAYDLIGTLEAGKEYWLHEEAAPDGYEYAEDVKFRVSEDGRIDLIVMKDAKEPDEDEPWIPEIPKKPEPKLTPEPEPDLPPEEVRIGRITAFYKRSRTGSGSYAFGGFSSVSFPKLGDTPITGMELVCLLVGSMLFGIWILQRTWHSTKRRKILGWILGVLGMTGLLVLGVASEGYASERENQTMVITFDAFTDACEEPVCPPQEYWQDDRRYDLKSSQLVSAQIEEKEQYAEKMIFYEAVEQADELPQEILLEVTDRKTGVTIEEMIPILKKEFDHWRWISGFEFDITVQEYDLGRFYLGDQIVSEESGRLFAGYEEALLKLIGVNPNYYRIEQIEWTGDAWTGEDGLVYRRARASGQKYVADCNVTYGGMVTLPQTEAMAWQAEYVLHTEKSEPAGETAASLSDETGTWLRYVSKQVLMVSIGILLLILILILGYRLYNKNTDH